VTVNAVWTFFYSSIIFLD